MKLLLHACCGPCALYPLDRLLDAGHEVTLFYLNPNIQPLSEWQRRLDGVQTVAAKMNVPLFADDLYLEREYVRRAADPNRCLYFYDLRLSQVQRRAAADDFEAFSTTLLVSPYQNRDAIVTRGTALAGDQLLFLADDWRSGYRQGQQAARDMGLYRQKYCGCLPSIEASRFKDEIRARHLAEAKQGPAEPPAPDSSPRK